MFKSCYLMLKDLDNNGRKTWCTGIKHILYRYGFGHVWLSEGVGQTELFLCEFKQRIEDISIQNWSSDVNSMPKLSSYKMFKSLLEPELYLNVVPWRKHRNSLSRLRCSNHRLAIERLRSSHERQERFCSYCSTLNQYKIEDEYHFLFECPLYKDIRKEYLQIQVYDTLQSLLSTKSETRVKCLAAFTYHGFKLHAAYNGLN